MDTDSGQTHRESKEHSGCVSIKNGLRSGQRHPAVRGQLYMGNIQGSTIHKKASMSGYYREQVAVNDEAKKLRGKKERRQMAGEVYSQ